MKESIKKYIPAFILSALAAIAFIFVYKLVKGNNALAEIEKDVNTNDLTYTQAQYILFADKIQAATEGTFGDDEEAIYDVFAKMQTNSDVLQLMIGWGSRTYWAGQGWFYNADLTEVLHSKLDNSEMLHINEILQNSGITITI